MAKLKNRPKKTGNDVAERPKEKRSVDTLTPWFCFAKLRPSHCISECTKDERAALAETLRLLSSMTWADLRQAPRHGRGYEKIARHSFRAHIPDAITEDVDLLSFRFCGKAPIVGYRMDRVFHVVWVDRAFNVYNHG
ncbi:hypothetical protein [Halomonas sp. A40-4]|uniref:hypothetical protein n=1 Tax=Halomonas sp. A40-4 TaxID=2785909 RepID=UPI0018EFE938|nr:hypothetical protein [Halomonas sp. A40-4]